jgi:glycosyltransferase involved in cell wall biosynthesis
VHVCVFTTAHPWDDVRVKSKFVDSFLDAGDRVTWVGPDRAFFERAENRDQRVDHRLVTAPPGWKGRLSSMRRLRATLASLDGVDWVYTPDPDAAALALTVRGTRVLFDIHEEYHKGHLAQRVPARLRRASEAAVRMVITAITRRCSFVTSVNDEILDAYRARPERRLATYNTPPQWFAESPAAAPGRGTTQTFFHGKALAGNGTSAVVEAVRLARRRGVDARVMLFPSPGAPDDTPYDAGFAERATRSDVADGLVLLAGQPHRAMPAVMARADVGLIAYDRNLAVGSLPNRFFEYLALGLPVIVPEYAPLMTRVTLPHRIGITADFEDPASVADAMAWVAENPDEVAQMGARAREVFRREFAWTPIFRGLRARMVAA